METRGIIEILVDAAVQPLMEISASFLSSGSQLVNVWGNKYKDKAITKHRSPKACAPLVTYQTAV